MPPAPLIVGLSGPRLTTAETRYLHAVRPLGVILFARNVVGREQVRELTRAAREASGCELVLVDQEGGRVQRIGPPLAPAYPAAAAIGALAAHDRSAAVRAAWLAGRLIGADLAELGLDVPCLPVADVPAPGSHSVIGDRAYGRDGATVALLAEAAAAGVLAAGCLPVVKHIPGHGRAAVDSHHELPVVSAPREALAADFAPFRRLAGLPMAMTAHVCYAALDDRPATLSPAILGEVVRGEIGFDGLLMTDDISMRALRGDVGDLGAQALAAGCDCVLHCNGRFGEMERLAGALPPLSPAGERRLAAALARRTAAEPVDLAALRAEFAALFTPAPA